MTLTLRKTIIKGETAHGDYLVLEDGKAIGRIHMSHGPNGSIRWLWNVQIHDPARTANGWADTMDEAKAAFKASWEQKGRPTT